MDFVLKKCDSANHVETVMAHSLCPDGKRVSLVTCAVVVVILVAPRLYGETIQIENASPDTFRYSIRRQTAGWSGKTLELAPARQHTFQVSEPLVVSYWTDKARFATLQPGRIYHLRDTRAGELLLGAAPQTEDVAAESGGDTPSADANFRVVKILAVADSTYRLTVDDWEQRIRTAIESASKFYEATFGIHLVVTATQPLDYKGLYDKPADRWKHLLRLSPEGADVLVAFIGFGDYYRKGDEKAMYVGHLGQGMPFGQHVMVSGERFVHPNRDRAVLIHELGHLFGAFHVQDASSVMQRGYGDIPGQDIIQGKLRMGAPLGEVVMLARNVDFRRGVESLSQEARDRIKSLCRQYRHPAERESPDPVEMGYRYLANREEALKQAESEAVQGNPPLKQE